MVSPNPSLASKGILLTERRWHVLVRYPTFCHHVAHERLYGAKEGGLKCVLQLLPGLLLAIVIA